MVVRKVANPAPSVLALVNPKRRSKKMAAKRKTKRRSTKRRTVHRAAPRKVSNHPKRRHTKRRVYASHRNPIYHRRRHARRHRNPLGGASGEIINFTVAGLAQGIAMPIVGGFAGRFLPFGQFNAPVISFGTGWLLSKVFGMFGFTRRFAHPALIFGAATAAMQVLQPIVARTIGGGAPANPTMSGWGNGYHRVPMRGIGVTTGIPPTITAPPLPPQNNQQGMNGMAMRPGNYAY
jgi:hypothetical protein